MKKSWLLLAPDAAEGGTVTAELKTLLEKGVAQIGETQKSIAGFDGRLKAIEGSQAKTATETETLAKQLDEVRKSQLAAKKTVTATKGGVSVECARHLGALALLAGVRQDKLEGKSLDAASGLFKDITGMEIKTAVASSDIPLPVGYGSEVVELVSVYGMARKFGTVFPLGNNVVKLPQLTTDPTFGLIAASGTVGEKVPQTAWVTFTAEKFGGLVRLPTEIDEDSIFAIGQFLARYAARNIARVEDHNFFVGTGAASGINGTVKGLTYSTIDNSKVTQMASTKTKYSDATLANLRTLRSVPDAAALRTGQYFMHPSFEQHLSGLNTAGDRPYNANGVQGATLDGFKINFVDIMPAYSTSANTSKVFILFGDPSYQYLGIRGGIRFDTSKEAGFTTDEILVRALERLTIGLMATGAVAGLETAAS